MGFLIGLIILAVIAFFLFRRFRHHGGWQSGGHGHGSARSHSSWKGSSHGRGHGRGHGRSHHDEYQSYRDRHGGHH